jgi:hypothetical protein
VKPGNEGSTDVTKYRPISLINIGGKLLEKLLIDRINYHVFSNNLLNDNQYGFLPQKSTTDTALAAKNFVRENLQQRKCVIMTGLEGSLAGDPEGYVEKALETGISSHRGPVGEPDRGLV